MPGRPDCTGPPPPGDAMQRAAFFHSLGSGLALPSVVLVATLGVVALQTGVLHPPELAPAVARPQTVIVAARPYSYRATGDFLQGKAVVDGPMVAVDHPAPVEIMKFEVSEAEYGRCVADGDCLKAEPRRRGKGNLPVTGVSYNDAVSYAAWLSARTGETWRLPSVAEWTLAAGSKARDHALGYRTDAGNPAERWLAFYEREAALGAGALAAPEPLGNLGENEFGVADLAGPVWEWTATCHSRTTLDTAGAPVSRLDSCGVRLLEGRHRTPMSAFIRDALGGGCNVGAPPDNLGFRLLRERPWWEQLFA